MPDNTEANEPMGNDKASRLRCSCGRRFAKHTHHQGEYGYRGPYCTQQQCNNPAKDEQSGGAGGCGQ
jgi:hypothetical protein